MSETNRAIVVSPANAITKRPAGALLPLTLRQIVPVIGVAAALAWGTSRIVARALAYRRQRQRLDVSEKTPRRTVMIYRRRAITMTHGNRD